MDDRPYRVNGDLVPAPEATVPVREGRYGPADVRDAAEAFLTNATWELRPTAAVDGVDVGGGPVTDLLSRLYDERVERTCYRNADPPPG